jgi:hypothetical protein
MKKYLVFLLIFLIPVLFSGCAVVGGIFKAGVWVGILAVAVVIAIIIFIIRGISKKS